MRCHWLFVLAALTITVGCSDDASTSSTSAATPTVESSVAPTTALVAPSDTLVPPPFSTDDNLFDAADVEGVCAEANRAAAAHAEQLGSGSQPLAAPEQLQYFQIRGGTVDVMIASLAALPGDPGVDVDAAVTALIAYNDWVHAQAAAIEQTGATVADDNGRLLDSARAALGGTGACGVLFDTAAT